MAENPRDSFRFVRRGRVVAARDLRPTTTVLDWLRLVERATGTKEGCAEGDCGACTVVLARLRDGVLVHEPVCACITLVGQADGAEVITVEDLAEDDRLHPVQEAMVVHHASQCGFCTPGIVMSLFALHHRPGPPPDRAAVAAALAGNLCRCTGYRPIVDAALAACRGPAADAFARDADGRAEILESLAGDDDVFVGDERAFFAAPAHEERLADLLVRHPDAIIVAGATDVGLWITKELRDLRKVVHLGRVAGLDRIEATDSAIHFGAAVSLTRAMAALHGLDPDLGHLMQRFASDQIRATATIGGNIANGSPIGDLSPALIALDATLELRRGADRRTLPLEAFFLDYRKQDRAPGEFVRSVTVPRLAADHAFRCYKITKRPDEDISAVMGAFRFTLRDGVIVESRLAFGGMAGVPKRAAAAEAALAGAPLRDRRAWEPALLALSGDFTPMSDHRASAAYRFAAARGLLTRALAEIAIGNTRATRLFGHREAAHVE